MPALPVPVALTAAIVDPFFELLQYDTPRPVDVAKASFELLERALAERTTDSDVTRVVRPFQVRWLGWRGLSTHDLNAQGWKQKQAWKDQDRRNEVVEWMQNSPVLVKWGSAQKCTSHVSARERSRAGRLMSAFLKSTKRARLSTRKSLCRRSGRRTLPHRSARSRRSLPSSPSPISTRTCASRTRRGGEPKDAEPKEAEPASSDKTVYPAH